MSGRALKHDGSKARLHHDYLKRISDESSDFHRCPRCTKSFKSDADYKAHYKAVHVVAK